MIRWLKTLSAVAVLAVASQARAQAPDFPPGAFTDGGRYQISDFKGKVLVLFFLESKCPRCRGSIPERNEVVKAMQGKPVAFIGIGANISPDEAAAYQQSTGLMMPIFADNLGVMQDRYKTKISLQNIWQFRVIDPSGKLVANDLSKATLDAVVSRSKTESIFKDLELDPKFGPVVAPFEHHQFAGGMRQLTAVRKTAKKADLPTLDKIQAVVKDEAAKWKTEAEAAATDDPLLAYDLYSRIAATLPGSELAKSTASALKTVAADKKVKAEVTARGTYNKASQAMATAAPAQKAAVANLFFEVAKKNPDTPTSVKAAALAQELGYEAPKKK